LTGAGISQASGIPTFRGEDGSWKKTGKQYADEADPS
jgi:NAD-dependent SIR2 family protein deacetylase